MDKETKQMFDLVIEKIGNVDKRLDSMEDRLDSIEKRQDEMYLMQRALEENTKITRAEQDKMMHLVVETHGKVIKLTSEVDDHESIIRQLKAIK